MLLKARKQINFNIPNPVYIIQKDYEPLIVQEDEESPDMEIDFSPYFLNAKKWTWGIRTTRYAGVFLTAFSIKKPYINLSVPDLILSIKRTGEGVYINCLVFGTDEKSAFTYASKFKKDNKDFISFEFSNEYRELRITATLEDLLSLIELRKEIKNIREDTQQIKERTGLIQEDILVLNNELREIKDTISLLTKDISEIKQALSKPVVNRKEDDNGNKVSVYLIKEDGVYSDGDKIYLNVLGSVFDYLEPNFDSFCNTFSLKINDEDRIKILDLVKKKYFLKERNITAEELRQLGINPKKDTSWEITLIVKDDKMRKILSLLEKYFKTSITVLEKSFKEALQKAVDLKTELSLELFEEFLPTREKGYMDKIKKIVAGKDKQMGREVYIKGSSDVLDILLYAVALEIERQNKVMEIKL